MTSPADDLELHRRRRRAIPTAVRIDRMDFRVRPLPTAATTPLPAEWAEGLVALLQREIRLAARHDVISTEEGNQLLARLVLIIDQALSSR
jgi:hypothetical protein